MAMRFLWNLVEKYILTTHKNLNNCMYFVTVTDITTPITSDTDVAEAGTNGCQLSMLLFTHRLLYNCIEKSVVI